MEMCACVRGAPYFTHSIHVGCTEYGAEAAKLFCNSVPYSVSPAQCALLSETALPKPKPETLNPHLRKHTPKLTHTNTHIDTQTHSRPRTAQEAPRLRAEPGHLARPKSQSVKSHSARSYSARSHAASCYSLLPRGPGSAAKRT
jgi:hypothetical protein